MATSRQNLRTARLLSLLRFGPREGALTQLVADAIAQRHLAIQNARGGAASLGATLDQIRPDVQNVYTQAAADRAAGFGEAGQAVAGLSGPAVDAIKAGMAREQAGAGSRAQDALTRDLSEIDRRKAAAQNGAIYETNQAQRQYRQDQAKIAQSLLGLAAEKGAFTEAQLATLSKQDRETAIKRGNLNIARQRANLEAARLDQQGQLGAERLTETQRHNRAQERLARRKARKQGGAGGGGGASPSTIRNAHRDIRKAYQLADSARQAGKLAPERVKPGSQTTGQKFVTFLTEKKGLDPLLAKAGVSYALYGRVDPKIRRQLMGEYGVGGVKSLTRRR